MLIVKVELHNANTGEVSVLGEMEIVNDGTGNKYSGNYDVSRWDGRKDEYVDPRVTRVEDWPRYPYPSVWGLVQRALERIGR